MISHFDIVYTLSDTLNDPSTFMSQDNGERSFWVFARESVCVAFRQPIPSQVNLLNMSCHATERKSQFLTGKAASVARSRETYV